MSHLTYSEIFIVVMQDGTKDRNATNTKLRLTIPREPELETAHRAQRIRLVQVTVSLHVEV